MPDIDQDVDVARVEAMTTNFLVQLKGYGPSSVLWSGTEKSAVMYQYLNVFNNILAEHTTKICYFWRSNQTEWH